MSEAHIDTMRRAIESVKTAEAKYYLFLLCQILEKLNISPEDALYEQTIKVINGFNKTLSSKNQEQVTANLNQLMEDYNKLVKISGTGKYSRKAIKTLLQCCGYLIGFAVGAAVGVFLAVFLLTKNICNYQIGDFTKYFLTGLMAGSSATTRFFESFQNSVHRQLHYSIDGLKTSFRSLKEGLAVNDDNVPLFDLECKAALDSLFPQKKFFDTAERTSAIEEFRLFMITLDDVFGLKTLSNEREREEKINKFFTYIQTLDSLFPLDQFTDDAAMTETINKFLTLTSKQSIDSSFPLEQFSDEAAREKAINDFLTSKKNFDALFPPEQFSDVTAIKKDINDFLSLKKSFFALFPLSSEKAINYFLISKRSFDALFPIKEFPNEMDRKKAIDDFFCSIPAIDSLFPLEIFPDQKARTEAIKKFLTSEDSPEVRENAINRFFTSEIERLDSLFPLEKYPDRMAREEAIEAIGENGSIESINESATERYLTYKQQLVSLFAPEKFPNNAAKEKAINKFLTTQQAFVSLFPQEKFPDNAAKEKAINKFLTSEHTFELIGFKAQFLSVKCKGFIGHHLTMVMKDIIPGSEPSFLELGSPSIKEIHEPDQKETRQCTGEEWIQMMALHRLLYRQYSLSFKNIGRLLQYKGGENDCHTFVNILLSSINQPHSTISRHTKQDYLFGRIICGALHRYGTFPTTESNSDETAVNINRQEPEAPCL